MNRNDLVYIATLKDNDTGIHYSYYSNNNDDYEHKINESYTEIITAPWWAGSILNDDLNKSNYVIDNINPGDEKYILESLEDDEDENAAAITKIKAYIEEN